jgi:hypothetical protein
MTTTPRSHAARDLNLEPNRAVPRWSETRWNGCWNPDEGVGLYLHMGRFRHDLDLWWAQTIAYLPGGMLAVDRSWGRSDRSALVSTGVFTLENTAHGWNSRYRGAPQLTTIDALERAPQGGGSPSAAVSWEMHAEPVSPVWDLYASRTVERQTVVGDTHIQQGFTTSGELTVAGRSYRLDGVGFKDHSSGTREWDGYGSHNFLLAVMPGWTLHAIMIYGPAGEPRGPLGAVFRDGEQIAISSFELAPLARLGESERDREYPVEIELVTGELIECTASVLHELPITITDNADNVNGIDWNAELPATVLQEGIARLTTADGTVGYSMFERGLPRQQLLMSTIGAGSDD